GRSGGSVKSRKLVIIPENAIIPDEKVRDYLLLSRAKNDKAKYLAQAGYSRAQYQRLAHDLRKLLPADGILQDRTRFGDRYVLFSTLTGPNGISLPIRTVWEDHRVLGWKFITLYPDKGKKR